MFTKKLLPIFFSVLLTTGFAKAHFTGSSSVDSGEIRWGGSTAYASQWSSALAKWNALDPINLLPDNAWTYEDLRVSDVNLPNAAWHGVYTPSTGTDTLKLNTFKMAPETSNFKQYVILHELGHSLGLGHSVAGNVMFVGLTPQITLGSHDKADYDTLY